MDFNIPSNRPMIQESQSMANNGGGGNLGYFQRGKKKKEDEPQNLWGEEDKFESSVKDDDDLEHQRSPANNPNQSSGEITDRSAGVH